MIDAVLFEFDGVLADTHSARRRALLGTLGEDGVLLTEAEYVDLCGSLPVRDAIRAALALRRVRADDTGVELAIARADRRFSEELGRGIMLMPGARALVDALHGRTRLAIVSRASRREIDHVLPLAGLEDAFEFVLADEDTFPSKPSPTPYLTAIERLSRRRPVRAANVAALEDGPVGIRSAKAAGLRCAAVGPIPAHLAMDADALLPTLTGQTLASIEALTAGSGAMER